jgi:hypothetical protein
MIALGIEEHGSIDRSRPLSTGQVFPVLKAPLVWLGQVKGEADFIWKNVEY